MFPLALVLTLYRGSHSLLPAVCLLVATQRPGGGTEADLPGPENADAALARLEEFEAGAWGAALSGQRPELAPQLGAGDAVLRFCPGVRRILYTTNAIESLHSQVHKAVRSRSHFPNDEAAATLIWLVLRNIEMNSRNPPIARQAARVQMALQFEERFVLS